MRPGNKPRAYEIPASDQKGRDSRTGGVHPWTHCSAHTRYLPADGNPLNVILREVKTSLRGAPAYHTPVNQLRAYVCQHLPG